MMQAWQKLDVGNGAGKILVAYSSSVIYYSSFLSVDMLIAARHRPLEYHISDSPLNSHQRSPTPPSPLLVH